MEQSMAQRGEVSHAILTYWQDGQEQRLTIGTAPWYTWLESAMSFRFRSESGAFTAQKARSGNGRGGWYWRAYCRRQGRLLRCYLGKSEDLSPERLRRAAQQLLDISESNEQDEFVDTPSSNLITVVPEETLVFTKLFIPRLSRQHISRPHLLARLDRAVETSLLTLVSAPAGSGKTTLLAEWSATKEDVRCEGRPPGAVAGSSAPRSQPSLSASSVAWLALESADDDVVRWLRYVIAALTPIDPRIGQEARTFLRLAQGGNGEQVLTSLINDLATYLTQDAILILDDYHLITSPTIHTLLLFLLDHLPPHLRLVIGTRSDPPLPLTRLRARGQLSEVRGEDLRFVPSEAAAFLHEMGLALHANDLQSLEQRTEGWIAGIQLLALALRGRANPSALLNTFAGTHRFISDYLSDEVLQRQPVERRDFLLRTSILERLCGPLCDTLTGRSDGQAQLSELRQANLFISALDDDENWYRYHPLFATVLRKRLQRQEPDGIAELYRRAGAWYEQQDLLFQAIEYTLRAGDASRAADLMEPLARMMVQRGDLTALQHWAEQLPNEVLFAHPHLCLAIVWVFLFDGQEAQMREVMAQVERYLREHQQESTTQEWRELRGELHIFEAVAELPNDIDNAIKWGHAALEVLPADAHYLRHLASLSIAITMSATYRASGDIAAAENVLVRLNKERLDGYHFLSMIAMHDLTELYQAQGHLHKMAQYYEHLPLLLPAITELPPLMFFSVYADYVALMYEWNRLDEATASMNRILQVHHQGNGREWIFSLMPLSQANISLAQGRVDEALRTLHEWDDIINTGTIPPPIRAYADAQRAHILLSAGRLEEALRWVHECGVSVEDQINEQLGTEHFFQYITLARVLIAQARDEQDLDGLTAVLKLLDRWCNFSKQRGFNGLLIEALTLKAIAFEGSGNVQQALAALKEALTLAEPEGYIRTFADKGERMARLLTSLAAHPQQRGTVTPTYIQTILSVITRGKVLKCDNSSSTAHHLLPTPRHASPIEPLTPREQEVLTLLADGASNQAIADALIITPNTAKRHVKHILGKLGAINRIQAVLRARELDLLSSHRKDTP
jgi:LuxR family maltose regulon positive regulatory protein